jgi:hypothetical protein
MASNNQLTPYSNSGPVSSKEQYAIYSGMQQLVQQVVNGEPIAVQKTERGYILHRAKICSVCTDNVSADAWYYCT